ncbi:MAG: GIY-YIG nuclease family protein [Candidatus Saccharibacteria bacterium]|nr:GIY-YIG nuclease family protein [Candidatus Saccharibacteria bacterium]
MWYFYVLTSEVDNEHYYGSTNDLQRRIRHHNDGKVESTKSRRPFKLIYYEAFLSQELARRREHTVKSSRGTRTALLKRLNIGV